MIRVMAPLLRCTLAFRSAPIILGFGLVIILVEAVTGEMRDEKIEFTVATMVVGFKGLSIFIIHPDIAIVVIDTLKPNF